jgi:hypothetical protein
MRPPPLLFALGVLLFVAGVILFARSLRRFAAAVRAKYTYGAPYRSGQIADRALSLLFPLPLAPTGALCLVLALGQAAFQPTLPGEPVKVADLDATRSGWGRTRVTLTPDPAYPERRTLEGEIEGARYAVLGDFLDWAPGVRWLGLVPAHRLRALAGAADVDGGGTRGRRLQPIDALPRMARWLVALDPWLPMLTVRTGASPWLPQAERSVAVLYVTPEGYLADAVASR